MEKQLRIYYDEEGDFLQIMFREPREDYGEHINKDIVFFKDSETKEIIGIGIFNFKKHSKDFNDIIVNLPINDIIVNLPIKVNLENI